MFLLIPEICFKRKKQGSLQIINLQKILISYIRNMFMVLLLSVDVSPRALVVKFLNGIINHLGGLFKKHITVLP